MLQKFMFSVIMQSQFKNKYVFDINENFRRKAYNYMHWHFFAAMHGKGAGDGIGATVKCVARKKVLSEK